MRWCVWGKWHKIEARSVRSVYMGSVNEEASRGRAGNILVVRAL